MQTSKTIWHNGELKAWEDATTHVMAHSLHYGSSVFEGARVYDTPSGPRAFRLREHIERLFYSARVYRMPVEYTPEQLESACNQVVLANKLTSAYLRPLIYYGAGTIGLVPTKETPVEVAIAAIEWGAYLGAEGLKKGVDVCISSWNRVAPNTIPAGAKAGGNYLSSTLISLEAKRHGYVEGIGLAPSGVLSEGAGENLFVVYKGKLYTPPRAASILLGITRDTVLTLAETAGIEIIEQDMTREFLYAADEIFFTGTAAEVTPVRSVDGLEVGAGERGPITERLQSAFFGLFDGSTPDRWGWLQPLEDGDAAAIAV